MPETVLVTKPEFDKGRQIFDACHDCRLRPVAGDEPSLARAVREQGCRAVIVGIVPYVGPLYSALAEAGGSQGALLARFGVGHDSIDRELARQHGIRVTNTPGALDDSVAEHTVWLMGCLARNVAACDAALRAGRFQPQLGIQLRGRTLGILGLGAIGKRVASIAHFGLGMRVLATGRSSVPDLEARHGRTLDEILRPLGLSGYGDDADAMLPECDVVSVHLPAGAETREFLDARRLGLMRRGALLVNTARGSLVDENALYESLESGHLGGAALDVFAAEPYRPTSAARDLRQLPNVLLTPHIGSNTQEANAAMARAALRNVRHFLAGRDDQLTRVT